MALFKMFKKKKVKIKPKPVKKAVKAVPKHVSKVKNVRPAPKASKPEVRQTSLPINKMPDERAYELLKKYRIKVPEYVFCKSEKDMTEAVKKVGFPMAMKVSGRGIIHKTEVNGIRLNINTPEDAIKAFNELIKIKGCESVLAQKMITEGYEIIIGGRKDPQFNKVIALGAGGVFTEFLRDVSFRVSPITKEDAENMVMEVRFADLLLKGFRGQKPANKDAIVDAIMAVSRLLEANPSIKEIDLNPVFATSADAIASDVRIILD
jgi:acetate---CoA ligase (ADP-forming) subunit beta